MTAHGRGRKRRPPRLPAIRVRREPRSGHGASSTLHSRSSARGCMPPLSGHMRSTSTASVWVRRALAPEISVAAITCSTSAMMRRRSSDQGSNSMAALIGDGWYASAFSWDNERYCFGDSPRRFLAQLELTFADGAARSSRRASWRLAASAVRSSEIYNGEDYDARARAARLERAASRCVGMAEARDRRRAARPARRPHRAADPGHRVADAADGHRAAARRLRVRLRPELRGPAAPAGEGRCGRPGTPALRRDPAPRRRGRPVQPARRQGDRHLHAEGRSGRRDFQPAFTYHGFRYVQVEGFPGTPTAADLDGLVIQSDPPITGALRIDSTRWSSASG